MLVSDRVMQLAFDGEHRQLTAIPGILQGHIAPAVGGQSEGIHP
jgi:hypothetical protein